ncbi:MAG: outer membrane lipid asymmetry maintenance protein MlaD [Rhodobacteraceae bacterium]|nr:outer membrane lipid asymmetry maintenance protein MlaD [Paracoccaceae bacterium]
MRENLAEVVTGGVVLAVAVGFLAFAAQSTGFSTGPGGDQIRLTASFRSAEGVSPGTDVRLAGVKIGTVTGMELNTVSYRADTTMTLGSLVPIPDDSSAIIASEGLLGGTFVEIVPGGSMSNFVDGGEIVDTQGSVSLLNLLIKFASGSSE